LVVVDWGAASEDYFSDLTRVISVGDIDPEFAKIAAVVKEANDAGRAAVRPGVPIGDVDRAAREVIEGAGYGPYFTHRLGHGLGMEEHEDPYAFGGNPLRLEPGMTFTVEPGIYLPGRVGVRIEDNVAVTDIGHETLTSLPREPFRIE
ncbi:MAG TPA: M24 family metallopeptidase, partial [Anaerolineaceae bacterium]